MPFKAYYLTPEGGLQCDISEERIGAAFESGQGLLWVDIDQTTEEDGKFLEQTFHFHHLPIEDCVEPQVHPPKIDDFGQYLFIIVHGIDHTAESEIVETAELAIFLSHHFVVSNHNLPLYSVEAVRHLVEDDGHPMSRGADLLVHTLVDALVDNVLPTIDRMSEVAEEIEEEAIGTPQQATLEAILKLKRSSMRIHRVMAPRREILNRLSRGDFPIIKEEVQVFYRDIYDHLVGIQDLNQNVLDRADNALTTYLSSVGNRQNETMKLLAMVGAVFLPLTLVAGIYGMNFAYMPELKWSWAYFAVLGFMGAAIGAAIWWFWKRKWITWGRRRVPRVRPFAVEQEKLRGYLSHLTKRTHR